MAYDSLHDALMNLPAAGPTGFEGLVRDVLTEVSGSAFRLMKSGPQGGVDAVGEPVANAHFGGSHGARVLAFGQNDMLRTSGGALADFFENHSIHLTFII